MNAPLRLLPLLALAGVLTLSGCGKKDHGATETAESGHAHDHDHDHEHDDDAAARFEEGHGLTLASETVAAIGLTTTPVERRALSATTNVTATVFEAGSDAKASTLVPVAVADAFASDPRVLAIRRDTLNALGQVELIVSVPGHAVAGATLELTLRAPPRDTLCVPSGAVLRTATGVFVYVQRGEHWSRTAVTTGANADGFTAITAGLSAGDTIATSAVEHLWLTELRLTKGGGHSH
ncbi:MAG: hypothetical protein HZA32_08230 [Opitutae bacterium]|nr:hypothetical protein [Opitutae bacterium]